MGASRSLPNEAAETMRWRFVDRVTHYEPWQAIEGRKAVSLEEYLLLDRLGRRGVLPESLVMECCVDLVRWLAMASSGFAIGALLAEAEAFAFDCPARMGRLLQVSARVTGKSEIDLYADCRVVSDDGVVASGRLGFRLTPLPASIGTHSRAGLWCELYAGA